MNKHLIAAAVSLTLASTSFAALAQSEETDTNEKNKSQTDETHVERISVVSRALNLYRNGESKTGKLSVDPLNATQMITTINEDLILDQGARDAEDIYRNIAGVSLFSYAGVTARGFRQEEIFFDGLRGDPYVGFNVPQLFNVERVDFLKGPAGMLYGPGNPGGLFNYVTKKPKSEFSANARAIVGNFNRVGGSLEITGETTDNQAGRLGLFFEDQDTFRDNTNSKTTIADLGYTFAFDDHRLTLQYTHYGQDLGGNRLRGVPVDDEGNFFAEVTWNHNEASDFLNLESDVFQISLDGFLTDKLSYETRLRYIDNQQDQNYHEPRILVDLDDNGVPDYVLREFRDQLRTEESTSFAVNFTYETQAFGANQRTAFGVEHFTGEFFGKLGAYRPVRTAAQIDAVMTRFFAGQLLPEDIAPLSLQDPNYGVTQPQNYPMSFRESMTSQIRSGAYLLNELAWNRFTVVAGIRFDQYEDESDGASFDDNEVTYRLGAVYKLSNTISFYSQWADSYVPQSIGSQRPETGGVFNPVTGDIIEAGMNAELFDNTTLLRIATYRIKRENLLQNTGLDPEGDGVDNLAALGEVTSEGVELEITADLTPNWVLSAAYAYNDARITADNGTGGIQNSVGERFANAPENTFGFWTRYQIPDWNVAFAFGGDYVDERLSLSGQTVKAYFIADLSITYEVDNYSVLLRVDNLFNRKYAESGFLDRTGHFTGETRNGFVEFTYKW